jgi:hypothetical protein
MGEAARRDLSVRATMSAAEGLMPTKESNAERYRRLARECLALLPAVSTPQARAVLIEMAQVWDRLSNESRD